MKAHDLFFIEPNDVEKFCKKSDVVITLYGKAYTDLKDILDNVQEVLEQKGIMYDTDMSVSDVLVYKMIDMPGAHYGMAINKKWKVFPETYEIMENVLISIWKAIQAAYGKRDVKMTDRCDRYNTYRSLMSRTSRDI